MTNLRHRLLVFLTILVVSVPVAASPAVGLSCLALPENLLEGIAADEAPDFWGDPDFVTTAVVGRVAEQVEVRDEFVDDGDRLGAVDVLFAIGRETVPARMEVFAGSLADEWGVGMLPPEGDLIAIYHTRAVGDPVPEELFLDICPNSERLDDDRAEAVRLLATDLGTLIAEPGDTPTTTTTAPPPTTTEPPTTTTAPPGTTTDPSSTTTSTTTTTAAPGPDGSGDDDSSNTWIVLLGIGIAAAVVVGFAAWGRLPGR